MGVSLLERGRSRSLFFSRDIRMLRELYAGRRILQQLSDDARLAVSEPIGDLHGAWNEVPERSYGVAAKATTNCGHSGRSRRLMQAMRLCEATAVSGARSRVSLPTQLTKH